MLSTSFPRAALWFIALLLTVSGRCALADADPPALSYNRDNEFSIVDMNTEPKIVFRVEYKDASGIDLSTLKVVINDEDVTGLAKVTDTYVEVVYMRPEGGLYHAVVSVSDKAGNAASIAWDVMYQAC